MARLVRTIRLSDFTSLKFLHVTRLLFATLVICPFVVGYAADSESPAKSGNDKVDGPIAIIRGYVNDEDGQALADARVRISIPALDMRFVDSKSDCQLFESNTNELGQFRFKIPGLKEKTPISIDASKPGYRKLVGTLMQGGDAPKMEAMPGATREVKLTLHPSLYFSGRIVDEQGSPLPDVKVSANADNANASGGVERTKAKVDGSFELFNYPNERVRLFGAETKGVVEFFHPHFLNYEIADIYTIPENERVEMKIVLRSGHKISGTVLDHLGKPVPIVMVKVMLEDGEYRKAVMTDENGTFCLRGLASGVTKLSVISFEISQKYQVTLPLKEDWENYEVRLESISASKDLKTYSVLGMQLTALTPELAKAFEFDSDSKGVLILDPGRNSDRLNIGKLEKGYYFWCVGGGDQDITSVADFVKQILDKAVAKDDGERSVRIVYSLSTLEFDGSNTQYLRLTDEDVKQLQAFLTQFDSK